MKNLFCFRTLALGFAIVLMGAGCAKMATYDSPAQTGMEAFVSEADDTLVTSWKWETRSKEAWNREYVAHYDVLMIFVDGAVWNGLDETEKSDFVESLNDSRRDSEDFISFDIVDSKTSEVFVTGGGPTM